MASLPVVQVDQYDAYKVLPTAEAVQSVLDLVTYKPGWSFRCWSSGTTENGSYRLWLAGYHTEPDSREPGTVREEFQRVIPIDWPNNFAPSDRTVMAWLRKALQEWEVHEMDEWLALDGKRWHDPHECPQCLIRGCRA